MSNSSVFLVSRHVFHGKNSVMGSLLKSPLREGHYGLFSFNMLKTSTNAILFFLFLLFEEVVHECFALYMCSLAMNTPEVIHHVCHQEVSKMSFVDLADRYFML